jgi:hypothetical protein
MIINMKCHRICIALFWLLSLVPSLEGATSLKILLVERSGQSEIVPLDDPSKRTAVRNMGFEDKKFFEPQLARGSDGTIYVTSKNYYSFQTTAGIYTYNPAQNAATLLVRDPAGYPYDGINGLAFANNRVYWNNFRTSRIYSARPDGSDLGIITGVAAGSLAATSDFFYWGRGGSYLPDRGIWRMNMATGVQEEVINLYSLYDTFADGIQSPRSVYVARDELFWINQNGTLYSTDLSRSSPAMPKVLATNISDIDIYGDRIYYVSTVNVGSMDLQGGNNQVLFATALAAPRVGMKILVIPEPSTVLLVLLGSTFAALRRSR